MPGRPFPGTIRLVSAGYIPEPNGPFSSGLSRPQKDGLFFRPVHPANDIADTILPLHAQSIRSVAVVTTLHGAIIRIEEDTLRRCPRNQDIRLENEMNEQILKLENEAEALKNEGKNEEAIAKINEALGIDEGFVRGHLALAVLYTKTQDFERACAHAEKAVELEPGDQFNMAALSVTYQRAFEGTQDRGYIQKAEDALARGHGMG